jgi:hypothetical protein
MRRHIPLSLIALLAAMSLAGCRKSPTPTPVCTLAVSPASHTVGSEGGSRTVTVTASDVSCAWTAAASVSWVALTGGGTGTGTGTFAYAVAANPGTDPRTGTILVGDQTHAIVQEAKAVEPPPVICSYQLTPESATAAASGGSGTFRVDTSSGCTWTAVPNQPWLKIASGAQGNGTGTVVYQTEDHIGASERTGTITVVDRTFTVRQVAFDASGCVYTVTPVDFAPCMTSGSVTAHVDTSSSCPWTVTPDAAWLTVDGTQARTGSGDIMARFSANYAPPREGVLAVRWPTVTAGQNVRVSQAGCLYATTVSVIAMGAAGGSSSFDVLQQAVPNSCGGPLQNACIWTASASAPWVTITSTMPRQGDNPVAFTVAANPGPAARTTTIVVQDRTVRIDQAGAP